MHIPLNNAHLPEVKHLNIAVL